MAINFIGKKAFRGRIHMMRVSSIIRMDQMAEVLGANINPEKVAKDDVCIYVKPHVKKHENMNFEGSPYLDMIDGHNLAHLAFKNPDVPLIVCSKYDEDLIKNHVFDEKGEKLKNKVIFIPQHHCNFERVRRTRTKIKRVGYLGGYTDLKYFPQQLLYELAIRNMDFVFNTTFNTREEVIDFYKTIDIQLIWRPYKMIMKNPLKMVNSTSFGIPSIALDEKTFQMELEGCYLPVSDAEEFPLDEEKAFKEFVIRLDEFRHPPTYNEYAQRCIEKSEKYHIDNVAKLYRKLT